MVKHIKKREEWFSTEISGFKKNEQALIKRIEKLDAPKEDDNPKKPGSRQAPARRKTKAELEEEKKQKAIEAAAKAKAAEEERLRVAEEERKRKEEEEAKAAAAKK